MPKGGDWTPLKHEATKFVKDDRTPGGSPNPVQPEALLSNFIRTCVTGGGNARAVTEAAGRRRAAGVEVVAEAAEGEAAGEVSGARRATPAVRSAASSQESILSA